MKKALLVFALSLSAVVAKAQLANLDFENWYTDSAGKLRLYNWEHLISNSDIPNIDFFGTWRDSLAEHGMYALTLSRWYSYTDDWVRQRASLSSKPSALNGYYQYTGNVLAPGSAAAFDTGLIQVFLTKWNSVSASEDTVGSGMAEPTTDSVYTAFNCSINYTSSNAPDSITINIFPTKWTPVSLTGGCASGGLCSYLTVDNLSLEFTSGISTLPAQHFRLYPNPVGDYLMIETDKAFHGQTFQALITDMLGKTVLNMPLNQAITQLSLQTLMPGNYFIVFKDTAGIVQVGKVTKK